MNKKLNLINKQKHKRKSTLMSNSSTKKTIINTYEIKCNQYYLILIIIFLCLIHLNGKFILKNV